MQPFDMMLVGCGMMGARHVRGFAELHRLVPGMCRLRAVCDRRPEMAQRVADEAEQLMGMRPEVFASAEEAVAALPDLQGADLVTDPRSHDDLAVALMGTGLHVLCEKPLACTVARGWRMVDAAERTGRVLGVAENNRHDPMARLTRAALDAGLIGSPNFVLNHSQSPAGGILATAWRHRLAMGGVLLDVGIHQGYMLEALLGPVDAVYGVAKLVQNNRVGREYDGTEVSVEADAEDCFAAVVEFGSGVTGQWSAHFASPGETGFKRLIIGAEGTLHFPSERSGQSPEVQRGKEKLMGENLVAALPDYHLNDIEAKLFGQRCAGYRQEYPITDRQLIAAELHDFVTAAQTGGQPEADGLQGLRAVALIYTILESSLLGRAVRVEEVLAGAVDGYQQMVEAAE